MKDYAQPHQFGSHHHMHNNHLHQHYRLPGIAVFGLCVVSFIFGRFTQQGAQLPQPQDARAILAPRRDLAETILLPEFIPTGFKDSSTFPTIKVTAADRPASVPAVSVRPPNSTVNPLNPLELENYLLDSSGLLDVRPPLTPSQSGDPFYHLIPFQILSWYPRIVLFPGFVDPQRCKSVVDMAKQRMYPSGLAYRPGDAEDPNQDTRTSTGTFLSSASDHSGVLAWIEERIAAVTMLPRENGEPFNVLHYKNGQHYDSHMDTFDPKEYGPQYSQRIATVVVYLSEVEEGGETIFKREGRNNGDKLITDWRSCNDTTEFKYKPRIGDAVLFWDVDPNLEIDPHALHGACPVIKGEKWSAAKWIRNR